MANKTGSAPTGAYSHALEQARQELASVEAVIGELETKRAKLRQTVAVLQSLMGIEVRQELSLTEAILMAVQTSRGSVTTAEVVSLLTQMGIQAQTHSVATILCRLAKQGKVFGSVGPNGQTGYAWPTEVSKAQREKAQRTLVGK